MNRDKLKKFDAIFNPQSIAIVGASTGRKMGGLAVQHLLRAGYNGKIFPINPTEREILGLKAYPCVREIPELVDHVIIMVPAAAVLAVIDDCIEAV